MESARLKSNTEIFVYEDDLPLLYEEGLLEKDGFICSGCFSKAIPCSYKPENLRRPHFKVESHWDDCDISKYKQLVKIGKKKKISTSSGFTLAYPSKLYLQDIDKRVIDIKEKENSQLSIPKNITSYQNDGTKSEVNDKHHRTSSTIRPIVQHFIDFPYDRSLPLQLPMLDSQLNTYNKVFKKINKFNITDEMFADKCKGLKLYYVKLSVASNNIELTDDNLSLKLMIERSIDYTLDININGWSERKRKEVINELLDLTEQKKELYGIEIKKLMKKNNKSYDEITDDEKKSIKIKDDIFIFFVGNLAKDNNLSFRLYNDDYRLYYARLSNIMYPKFS